ncbi:hypothetical protein RBWH47_02929 [Rhodopirellula baltica WH47]|uniref:Uncharacterized protein n=1 Tax=Rhodopirellula baltica WH47 TaxID=991778 RepID=F2B132_RHOBT|nr:hypothetical protein RBWH47_02929 [Rhodopirellula baltica WH47]
MILLQYSVEIPRPARDESSNNNRVGCSAQRQAKSMAAPIHEYRTFNETTMVDSAMPVSE